MPEISDAELRTFARYQNLGTPEEVQKKINDLEVDNRKYRQEEKPALEARLANLPPEGAVVLTGDEAKIYPALKELGDPTEIKVKLEKLPTLEEDIARRDKRERLGKAAKLVSGADGAAAHLEKYIPDLADRLEFREVTEGEKKVEAAFFKPAEGDAKPLGDYLKDEHPLVWSGLQSQSGGGDEQGQSRRYPRQVAGGDPPKKTNILDVIGQRDVRPSKVKQQT